MVCLAQHSPPQLSMSLLSSEINYHRELENDQCYLSSVAMYSPSPPLSFSPRVSYHVCYCFWSVVLFFSLSIFVLGTEKRENITKQQQQKQVSFSFSNVPSFHHLRLFSINVFKDLCFRSLSITSFCSLAARLPLTISSHLTWLHNHSSYELLSH